MFKILMFCLGLLISAQPVYGQIITRVAEIECLKYETTVSIDGTHSRIKCLEWNNRINMKD